MSEKKSYLIDLLCRLVETESPTGFENNIAHLIEKEMQTIGFNSTFVDDKFNVVATLKSNHAGKNMLLLIHSDTSPLTPEQRPPKAEVLPGKDFGKNGLVITGPGVVAPKASIASILEASRMLSLQKDNWKGSITVAVVTKDLNANHDGPREIASMIKDVDFAITAEPSDNNVVMATRGIMHIKVRINGISTHWSIPEIKQNVFYILGNFLEELSKIHTLNDSNFGLTGYNPINLQLNPIPPCLPKHIDLIIDRRVLPGESVDQILGMIKLIAKKMNQNDIQVSLLKKMFPFQAKEVFIEENWLKEIIKEVTRNKPKEIMVNFASNAAFLTNELNIRSLVFGPGNLKNIGGNEHIDLKSLEDASRVYTRFALKYLN